MQMQCAQGHANGHTVTSQLSGVSAKYHHLVHGSESIRLQNEASDVT